MDTVQMVGRVFRKDGDYFSYEPVKILKLSTRDLELLDKALKDDVK